MVDSDWPQQQQLWQQIQHQMMWPQHTKSPIVNRFSDYYFTHLWYETIIGNWITDRRASYRYLIWKIYQFYKITEDVWRIIWLCASIHFLRAMRDHITWILLFAYILWIPKIRKYDEDLNGLSLVWWKIHSNRNDEFNFLLKMQNCFWWKTVFFK